jgi:DNA modification methylase
MLTLAGEKAALWKAWRRTLKSYFQHALDCRDIGAHWNSIKTRLTELRKAGRSTLTIELFDEFGNFANEWPQFEGAWKLWQEVNYTSDRGAPRENIYKHPAPKPLKLYLRMLDVAGKPGGRFADLFSGSGTGAAAAIRWGMECISIENDPTYCDAIRRRILTELCRRRD